MRAMPHVDDFKVKRRRLVLVPFREQKFVRQRIVAPEFKENVFLVHTRKYPALAREARAGLTR